MTPRQRTPETETVTTTKPQLAVRLSIIFMIGTAVATLLLAAAALIGRFIHPS